jgi:hypothetical protein
MRLALSLAFKDSRRRLELRRRSGVCSHSATNPRAILTAVPSCGKLLGTSRLHATHYANTRITTDRGICEVFGFESNWCSEKRSRNTEIANAAFPSVIP